MTDSIPVITNQPGEKIVTDTFISQHLVLLDPQLQPILSSQCTFWTPDKDAREGTSVSAAALRYETRVQSYVYLDGLLTIGEATLARSGTYFINGRIKTLEEMRRLHTEDAMYMQSMGWTHLVYFAHGGCTGFNPDTDHVVTV